MIKNGAGIAIMDFFIKFINLHFRPVVFTGIDGEIFKVIKSLWRINFITDNLGFLEKSVNSEILSISEISSAHAKNLEKKHLTATTGPQAGPGSGQKPKPETNILLDQNLNAHVPNANKKPTKYENTLKISPYRITAFKFLQTSYFNILQLFFPTEPLNPDFFARLQSLTHSKTTSTPLPTSKISGKIGKISLSSLIEIDPKSLIQNFTKTTKTLLELTRQFSTPRNLLT
jgi:hypothetical protein